MMTKATSKQYSLNEIVHRLKNDLLKDNDIVFVRSNGNKELVGIEAYAVDTQVMLQLPVSGLLYQI